MSEALISNGEIGIVEIVAMGIAVYSSISKASFK
jgi:hypothetical protein